MRKLQLLSFLALTALVACFPQYAVAQSGVTVLAGAELTRVVPPGFYFQGQSAPTQMRNAAAARFGTNRHVVAGLVDTSGYAADVRARYEGFLITDSTITINGSELAVGAYGFGFSGEKLNVLDVSGKEILSVSTARDNAFKRPRPLTMVKAEDGVRLYSGKDYVTIQVK